MGLIKNCKETSTLVTQSMDRRLNWHERLGMRLHLMICDNCVRFVKQMNLIRSWLSKVDEELDACSLDQAARERIARKLQEKE